MGICHYLFWKEKDKIAAILHKGNAFEIIKFGGYTMVQYTTDYWEKWKEYAGFLKEDFIDFCFIVDNECPQITEYLKERECPDHKCIWDRHSIQKAVDMLEIIQPTEIYNQQGRCIVRSGAFRGVQEAEINRLVAVYRTSEETELEENPKEIEITPFIKDMLTKLRDYDKQ